MDVQLRILSRHQDADLESNTSYRCVPDCQFGYSLCCAQCAMQLRHKKCMSVIHNHKWPLADGIASPHMDSVVPVKKAKLRQKNAVNIVQIPLHQCQYEVCLAVT